MADNVRRVDATSASSCLEVDVLTDIEEMNNAYVKLCEEEVYHDHIIDYIEILLVLRLIIQMQEGKFKE